MIQQQRALTGTKYNEMTNQRLISGTKKAA
jgi:hypothetical protein